MSKPGSIDRTNISIPGSTLDADVSVPQDITAVVTRPSDFNTEVALNRRAGYQLWNKFGYNNDVDVGTEVIAAWGGTFSPLTTATTINIASSSSDDTSGGTGVNSVVVYGLDENRDEVIEVFTMNGTTPVISISTWLGVNRVAMFLCGSGQVNAGELSVTATTGGSTMALLPAGGGVTQQCIFHVPRGHQFLMEWLWVNAVRPAAQDPVVTIKFWVYSAVSNGKQEVFKKTLDTAVHTEININPNLPFPVSEKTVVWIEVTTDKADTIIEGRFSGILVQDAV